MDAEQHMHTRREHNSYMVDYSWAALTVNHCVAYMLLTFDQRAQFDGTLLSGRYVAAPEGVKVFEGVFTPDICQKTPAARVIHIDVT